MLTPVEPGFARKNCDTVRMELSSRSYWCRFEGEDDESLIETNRYITGKNTDKFCGEMNEIIWDLDIRKGIISGVENGVVKPWDSGNVHIGFKIVDGGNYILMGNGREIFRKDFEYVPDFLQIEENGYGDYIEIDIEKNGKVKGWNRERINQVYRFFGV
jgi:hypothetical protein